MVMSEWQFVFVMIVNVVVPIRVPVEVIEAPMLLLFFVAMVVVLITSIVMRGEVVLVVGVGVVMTLLTVLVLVSGCMLLLEWVITLETMVILLFIVRAWPVKKLMVVFMPLTIFMVLLLMLRNVVLRSVSSVTEMLCGMMRLLVFLVMSFRVLLRMLIELMMGCLVDIMLFVEEALFLILMIVY